MKKENKELLTTDLYNKIATSKKDKIAELKNFRAELIKEIGDESEFLKDLEAQREQLLENIKASNDRLNYLKSRKFKLNREMRKERRLVNKLNKLVTKEKSYIDVSSFNSEENIKTR